MSDLDNQNNTTTSNDEDHTDKGMNSNTHQHEEEDHEDNEEDDKSYSKKQHDNRPDENELKRLRNDSRKSRLEIKELRDLVTKAVERAENASLETSQLKKTYEQRIIDAELKIAANEYGLQDFDAFKMVDLSTVKVGKNGDVTGIKELMDAMKNSKPYLFKTDVTTSSKVRIPNNNSESESRKSLKGVATKEVDAQFNDYLKSI